MNRYRTNQLLAAFCLLGWFAAPCAAAGPRPLLLHLPGVGGHMRIDDLVTSGLLLGGIDADVQIYDWTAGDPGMDALTNYRRNQQQARQIADLITLAYRADPARSIILTCHSGGAGLATWALEMLPDEVRIDTLLYLAPAISPQYDLSPALRHVVHKAYAFSSTHDPIVSFGTRTFGTIDRVNIESAGFDGFKMPATPADAEQYRKLVNIPYDPAWTRYGNAGDHIGTMMRPFARNVLAPLLLSGNLPVLRPSTVPATQPAP